MRKGNIYLITATLVLLISLMGYSVFYSEYSDEAKVGMKNIKNLQEVRIGMDSLYVLKIMGSPSDRYVFQEEVFYNYEVPPGSSYQGQIIFNKMGKVNYISPIPPGEE